MNMGTPGCPYLRGVYMFMTPGPQESNPASSSLAAPLPTQQKTPQRGLRRAARLRRDQGGGGAGPRVKAGRRPQRMRRSARRGRTYARGSTRHQPSWGAFVRYVYISLEIGNGGAYTPVHVIYNYYNNYIIIIYCTYNYYIFCCFFPFILSNKYCITKSP